jgi:hypothetical protein
MPPQLPKETRFEVPAGRTKKKYVAIVPQPGGRELRVSFGHRDYEHYKDQVPPAMGGGRWSHKDHRDSERRKNYRRRHGAQLCADKAPCYQKRYSPAWFSYYYLW